MPYFRPDATFLRYGDVTPEFLRSVGVETLVLDVDNTLAPYEQPDADEALCRWLASLAEAGVKTAILSNNHGDRVTRFNEKLGLPFLCGAKKPLGFKARKLLRSLGADKKTTAFLGDQIFTDVLTARAVGARAFLVPPIKDKTDPWMKTRRFFERRILRGYYKKHPEAPDVRAKKSS